MKHNVIAEIRQRADAIGKIITELHPLTPKLERPDAQAEILRALFELTKQVEVIKKQLLRVEKDDQSKLL